MNDAMEVQELELLFFFYATVPSALSKNVFLWTALLNGVCILLKFAWRLLLLQIGAMALLSQSRIELSLQILVHLNFTLELPDFFLKKVQSIPFLYFNGIIWLEVEFTCLVLLYTYYYNTNICRTKNKFI